SLHPPRYASSCKSADLRPLRNTDPAPWHPESSECRKTGSPHPKQSDPAAARSPRRQKQGSCTDSGSHRHGRGWRDTPADSAPPGASSTPALHPLAASTRLAESDRSSIQTWLFSKTGNDRPFRDRPKDLASYPVLGCMRPLKHRRNKKGTDHRAFL